MARYGTFWWLFDLSTDDLQDNQAALDVEEPENFDLDVNDLEADIQSAVEDSGEDDADTDSDADSDAGDGGL